jgi:hypothetical protein
VRSALRFSITSKSYLPTCGVLTGRRRF